MNDVKKSFPGGLPAPALLGVLGGGAQAQNVSIGDFETGALAPWVVNNGDGAKSEIAFDSQNAYAGKIALRLQQTSGDGFVQLQSDFIPVAAESSYRVAARLDTLPRDLKTKIPSAANVYFMVSQYKPQENVMNLPNIFGPSRPFFSSDKKWEKLDMDFSTRAGVDRVRISLILASDAADLLIDDI